MCDLCAKGFFDYEFNSADIGIGKISNFNEIASNFTYSWTSKFFKYNWTDTDHLLLKSKFYGRVKSGMYFCIFGSCEPLRRVIQGNITKTNNNSFVVYSGFIARRLSRYSFVATHIACTNIRNQQSCCARLASADVYQWSLNALLLDSLKMLGLLDVRLESHVFILISFSST